MHDSARRRAERDAIVIAAPFSPPAERRSVLDRAHRGDIEGALGHVRAFDTGPRRSLSRRLATLLAIMGPGVVVMVADNDAGSISIYGQAGQNYGLTLLWLLLVLAPVLFVNQEMVARLGAVTGAGHARLIFERFGRRWGTFALSDLLALCLLTIITEFIGVDFALSYFGVSRYLSVPLAAVLLVAMTASGSFRRWERAMYVLLGLNFVVIPLALLSHPRPSAVAQAAVPGLRGALNVNGVLFLIALVGATLSPAQLFFHQSSVVDKRITARWLRYERIDTLLGSVLFTLGATALVVTCAFAFNRTPMHGAFVDVAGVIRGLAFHLGAPAGTLFALVLLNGSILGTVMVTLAASYAVGDVFGVKHSLHRRWYDARLFYGSFAAFVAFAAAVVLIPGAPLGIVNTAVQALAGLLLPSATVFLLLLCNDVAVLGPWKNPTWLNAVAAVIVGALLVLSALLTLTTLLPDVRVTSVAVEFAAIVGAGLVGLGLVSLRRGRGSEDFVGTAWERATWTMPPLETLPPPPPSRARAIGLTVLRLYFTLAAFLLVIKVVRLALAG